MEFKTLSEERKSLEQSITIENLSADKVLIFANEQDKEFIKRLKEEPWDIGKRAPDVRDAEWIKIIEHKIDKLAGDKLI